MIYSSDDHDGYNSTPSNPILDEIPSIASFLSKRMVQLRRSFITAQDEVERLEAVASIVMCSSALSVLHLAYLTEQQSLIEDAKSIYRGIQT